MECEAGVYALSSILSEDDSDVILLLDADNVFNRVNQNVMLNKILMICPVIVIYVINLYTQETRLLILGGEEIASVEGIIQGDPTAISIYAVGSLLLLNVTTTDSPKYATHRDDISYIGILKNILTWRNKLNTFGPKTGYFLKVKILRLIVKPEKYETVEGIFKDAKSNITNEGKKYL